MVGWPRRRRERNKNEVATVDVLAWVASVKHSHALERENRVCLSQLLSLCCVLGHERSLRTTRF